MNNKQFQVFKVKVDADSDAMTFTAYGNVKNVADKVNDIAVDGCYQKSIDRHKGEGTMPRMLWSHDPKQLPVGVITSIEEDNHGLKFSGKLSDTTLGREIYALAKDGALDSFSIGYIVKDEEYDRKTGINYLKEIDIKEISWVNFACNEASLLQEVKSNMENDKLPTQRELKKLLQENCELSARQADKIAGKYNGCETFEAKYDDFCDWCAYDYDVLTMTLDYSDPEFHGKLYAGSLATKLDRAGFDSVSAIFDGVESMKSLIDAIALSGNGKVNEVLVLMLNNYVELAKETDISAILKACADSPLFKSTSL